MLEVIKNVLQGKTTGNFKSMYSVTVVTKKGKRVTHTLPAFTSKDAFEKMQSFYKDSLLVRAELI